MTVSTLTARLATRRHQRFTTTLWTAAPVMFTVPKLNRESAGARGAKPPYFTRQSRVFVRSFARRGHPIRLTSRNMRAHAPSFDSVVPFVAYASVYGHRYVIVSRLGPPVKWFGFAARVRFVGFDDWTEYGPLYLLTPFRSQAMYALSPS